MVVFILIILIIAFVMYLYMINVENFVTSSYTDYVKDLTKNKVPFGKIFSRDAYNVIISSEDPEKTYKILENI